MEKPEIVSMLVLSTAHLRKEHAEHMDNCKSFDLDHPLYFLIFDRVEYGYLVWVQQDVAMSEDLPHPWPAVFEFARGLEVEWIKFDSDARTVPELPTFDW